MSASSLRMARAEDAARIAAIYEPWVRTTTISFELEPPSAKVVAERIETVTRSHPWLVLEREGVVEAYAYATRLRTRPAYDWIAETSVYVDPKLVGGGRGARVYAALLDLLRVQGMIWAYAAITLPNPGSQRFHARLGFETLGRFPEVGFKHGQWCDIEWWRYRLAPTPETPAPVTSIADPALAEAIAARLNHHS